MVMRRGGTLEGVSGDRGGCGDKRCAGDGCLGDSGAAKNLRGTPAATARKERHALFYPESELAETPVMPERRGGHWKERRCGCALELAPTHFAAQSAIDLPARNTRGYMGSCQSRIVFICLARRIGGDHSFAELAHAARRRDGRDSIQLGVGATGRRAHFSEREP